MACACDLMTLSPNALPGVDFGQGLLGPTEYGFFCLTMQKESDNVT